jgi:hypothetical protein
MLSFHFDSRQAELCQPECLLSYRAGSFNVAVRELLNYYVAMEEFVMEKDVQTAISIREHSPGNLTTSMVIVLMMPSEWLLDSYGCSGSNATSM